MADNISPPIPKGFVLESGTPQIPPGFELEVKSDPFLDPGAKEQFEVNKPETLGQQFTGELRETEQTKSLPEFSETEDIEIGLEAPGEIGKKLKMTVGLLSSFTPEGQANVIKDSIPEAKFTQDEKGNTIIDINGRKSVLNQPGASSQDVAQTIAGIVAFLPAAKIASLVKNVFGRVVAGGAAAGATEQAIQETSLLAGSEEERSPVKTAFATVLGAGAEAVGPVRKVLKDRSAAKKLGAEVADIAPAAESVAVAEEAVEATGIPLFKAQKTVIPAQLEKQSFIAQLPAGARKASASLKNQNVKASEAVENLLNKIAPPESIITGAGKFRTAAQKAIDVKKAVRREASSPFFEEAKEIVVDVKDVLKLIDDEAKPFLGSSNIKTQLEKIKTNIARDEKPGFFDKIEASQPKRLRSELEGINKKLKSADQKTADKLNVEKTRTELADANIPGIMQQVQEGAESYGERLAKSYRINFDKPAPVIPGVEKASITHAKARKIEIEKKLANAAGKPEPSRIISNTSSTIEELQKAKAVIDDILSSTGETKVSGDSRRIVQNIKESLLTAMDGAGAKTKEEALEIRGTVKDLMLKAQSGGEIAEDVLEALPTYAQARVKFAQASPEITELTEGIIGKAADIKDIDLKKTSRVIFDPAETNPQVVLAAKKVITAVDSEAWDQLLRVELERRLGSISADVAEGGLGAVENVPKLLERAIFGNPKQKAILMKAVDGEALQNLKFLETALKRAGLGRPGGSQTAIRGEIAKEFDVGVVQAFRNFVKSPIQTIAGGAGSVGEEAARNKRIRAAAEMFFDPKYKNEVAKIRKMNPNLAIAGKATTQLLKIIEGQLEDNEND